MTDYIHEIIQRGIKNRNKYAFFLRKIKKSRKLPLESLFRNANEMAFRSIDCLDCGNCCSSLGPGIKNNDITILAKRERLKPSEFIKKYLIIDEDDDFIFKAMPCPFLGSDNYCYVYEDRPAACRDYPHMDRGRQSSRVNMHIENLGYCPAVVLAVEDLIRRHS